MSAPLNQTNLNIQPSEIGNSNLKTAVTPVIPAATGMVSLIVNTIAGSAGADIAATGIYVVPTGKVLTINRVVWIPTGTSAGIDDSNTLAVSVEDTAQTPNVVAAKTWDADPAYPAANVPEALTVTDKNILVAGTVLAYKVTQGATADHNGFTLLVEGMLELA